MKRKLIEGLIIFIILIIGIILLSINVKRCDKMTAKMGVNWVTNTCYLYWE